MSDIESRLADIPVFEKVPPEALAQIASVCKTITREEGVTVLKEGQPGDGLYIIEDGSVGVVKAGHRVAMLGPEDSFGEMSLVDAGKCSASVVTMEPCTLLLISRDDFESLMSGEPTLAVGIYRGVVWVLCQRLRDTTEGISHLMDAMD